MFVNSKFGYDDFKVGQRVRLRDGTEKTVTEVRPHTDYFPVRCGVDGWTSEGCWTRAGRSMYSNNAYSTTEHAKDIVDIIGGSSA